MAIDLSFHSPRWVILLTRVARLVAVLFAALAVGHPARAAAAPPVASEPTSQFHLLPGVPIVLSPNSPSQVHLAVADLQRDLKAVLGKDSPLIISGKVPPVNAIVVMGPGDLALPRSLRNESVRGWEAHSVHAAKLSGRHHMVLQGADLRGTLYAIYSFSEQYLGIPPLWYWTSHKPVRLRYVTVGTRASRIYASPSVKWRTWFPNDTDLLTPWEERSEDNFRAIYETMLRLKLNTLEGWTMGGDPGKDADTFDRPYTAGRDATMARDRGLAFTGHHINPLGAAYWHWNSYWTKIRKQTPPALSVKNLAQMREFWRYHLETARREKLEMVWLIGFRGVRDTPFWDGFQDAPRDDAGRARLINQMMQAQVDLLKEVTGEKAPTLRATLYNEVSDFFEAGLIQLPREPNLIWTFANDRRDHFPSRDIREFRFPPGTRTGYYMNLQYTGTGSHLAQGEGPWKMEKNYRMVAALAPGGLEFSVVNAGNIREFVMELSANARMMWDMESYTSDQFLLEFCRTYYGAEHASQTAKLYRQFYASYWEQRPADLPDFPRQYIFHDLRHSQAIRALIAQLARPDGASTFPEREPDFYNILPAHSGQPDTLGAVLSGTNASIQKLRELLVSVDEQMANLPEERRTFFNDNLRVQARFMLQANLALHALARATRHREDLPQRTRLVGEARAAIDGMWPVLQEAEHGRFESWYRSDFKFRIRDIQNALEKIPGH